MAKSKKIGGWNKGKTVGQKRPFTQEQVQLIRGALEAKEDKPGLALFETALSTALRSSDLLKLVVSDVTTNSDAITDRFWVKQTKTGDGVEVSLSTRAQFALAVHVVAGDMKPGQRLWPIGRLRYSQIVKTWAGYAHADPKHYSTHSMRRTLPTHIHKKTGAPEHARQILGHKSLVSTAAYLGVSSAEVREIKKLHEM